MNHSRRNLPDIARIPLEAPKSNCQIPAQLRNRHEILLTVASTKSCKSKCGTLHATEASPRETIRHTSSNRHRIISTGQMSNLVPFPAQIYSKNYRFFHNAVEITAAAAPATQIRRRRKGIGLRNQGWS